MKLLKRVSGVVLALSLMAACSTYDLDAINDQTVESWPFAQALHGQYMRLAYDESKEHDWDDALFFAGKARAAADAANEGATLPDPQMVGERRIPQDSVIILTVAYDDLVEALADGRRTRPVAAAQAQTAFDCWLQELEENIRPERIALCRDDFDAAMELLTATATISAGTSTEGSTSAQVGPFMIYFGFDSAELDDAARALIKTIAGHKIAGDPDGKINLVGHTDRAGAAGYNDDLSLARVSAVGNVLGDEGVVAGIYMSFMGEEMLATETTDGVRDARNRRVEIRLSR